MDQQHRWRGLAMLLLRLTALLLLLPAHVSARFFQPGEAREVWRVGDVKTIEYSTTMTNYTITLWQEVLPKSKSAIAGPVLVREVNGPATQFKWEVQTYGFNLSFSNIFYLWLREGGPDNRMNMNAQSMSTPYFNITDEPLASAYSTSTSLSMALPSSSSSSATSSSAAPSSTTSFAYTPVSTTSTADGNASSANNNSTESPASSTAGNGLPVGAQAGIGVGVSVVGVTCIVCAVMWFRHLKKKRELLADMQQSVPPMSDDPWKPHTVSPGYAPYYASEMDTDRRHFVEMDTSRHRVEMPSPYNPGDGRPAELGGH